MIEATRRWFRRNRTNLLIGAGVVGAGYVAGQYVLGKIREARQRLGDDRVAKENLRRRFQQNQEDCRYTVLALLPTIRDEIIGALPVEHITEQLQSERQERLKRLGASEAPSSELPSGPPSLADDASSLQSGSYIHASQMAGSSSAEGTAPSLRTKRSKAQLWQEMKISAITRALALLYTVSLLTLLTRIQLNLLGRRTYLSSVVALASPPPATEASTISLENKDDDNYDNVYGSDFETNRRYLTFSWWLLHRGSKQVMDKVMMAVKEVFGSVNIREDITLDRLGGLIMQVRKRVEGSTEAERRQMDWLTYLLPPGDQEAFVMRQARASESEDSPSPDAAVDDPLKPTAAETETITPSLRRLLDETSDLVDSPTFSHVLTRLLDATFSHLVDFRIAVEAYKADLPVPLGADPRVTEVSETTCKVAHILPVFCKQAHAIAAGSGELDDIADASLSVDGQPTLRNEYLDVIEGVHDLEAFAAVIYSSNFEYEALDSDATSPPPDDAPATSPFQPAAAAAGLDTGVRGAADSISLGASGTEVPHRGAGLTSPPLAEQSGSGAFDAAWNKAVADESSS